jgi:hypothetical protein
VRRVNLAFAPHRLTETFGELYDAQPEIDPVIVTAEKQIAACDRKLLQHRRALEAGADPELVAGWMREVQAQRAIAAEGAAASTAATRLTDVEIEALITSLGDTRKVLAEADPARKNTLYKKLGLELTYRPGDHTVRANVSVDPKMWGYGMCPRPELRTIPTLPTGTLTAARCRRARWGGDGMFGLGLGSA